MSSKNIPPELKPYVVEATNALHKHELWGGFRPHREKEHGSFVELLKIETSSPISITTIPAAGRWSLHINWTFRRDPEGGEWVLWQSSIGLSVADVSFVQNGKTECLARYDYDNNHPGPALGPIGPHLNILQPDPLKDSLHFPVLSDDRKSWSVEEVLDALLSDQFKSELLECIGPQQTTNR